MSALPDREQIRRAIEVLHAPDAVIELRALHEKGRRRTDAGYFDRAHRNELIEEAVRPNSHGAAVYVVMNPLDPQLLARHANRVQEHAAATATDSNVVRRWWFLADIDPQRPKDTSATNLQFEAAMDRARKVYAYLAERGWPRPVVAESGNGAHLLYRMNLPNDDASREIVKQCLEALAVRFDDSAVKIDRSVFNAGRIVKLHGTVANKGDNIPTAPWRLSRLCTIPEPLETVPVELLQTLAAEAPQPKHRANKHAQEGNGPAWTETTVAEFLSRGNLDATGPDTHNGALRWKLKRCPFNPDHGPTESAVLQLASGALVFRCLHNSCADRHWQDLRELVDGPRETCGVRGNERIERDTGGFGSTGGEPLPNLEDTTPWSTPRPITAELKPVAAFDPEVLLSAVLRDWIMDEAERMPCPPDYIAAATLCGIGSLIGARCAVKPKRLDNWLIVPNLWGGIVGDPSTKKSPAWGAGLRWLDRLIAEAAKAFEEDVARWNEAMLVYSAQKEGIEYRVKQAARRPKRAKKGEVPTSAENPAEIAKELTALARDEPQKPVHRRYKTNDSTIEKLGELLRDNPNGLLVMRDELVGLVATWEREGREGERAFFLEAWNGNEGFDTDRIGRGHISIPNLCASIFGGIQPDKLIAYLEQATDALANDGMLQRFQLLVYPDARQWEWRDRAPNKAARDSAFDALKRLADFDPVTFGAAPADEYTKFPHFFFDEGAQAVFVEWSIELHCKRISLEEQPIIKQHLSKYDKLCPALALIFHLVDCAAGGAAGPIRKESVLRAAGWCEYLETHARRCYGLLMDEGQRAAQALATKLLRGALEDGFTLRDVRRNGWRHLKTDESVQAALDWLEGEDWIRLRSVEKSPVGGRPTVRYAINPALPRKAVA